MIDPYLLAIPAFIALMILEALVVAGKAVRGYEARDTATSLTMGVGNLVVSFSIKAVTFGLFAGLYAWRVVDWNPYTVAGWCAAIVAYDFLYYWFHRAHHEVRFLWAAHVNHHSSTYYNLSTALRQSWTTPFTGLLFYWPLPLLGFPPEMILAVSAIDTLYQFWIHTEAIDRVGPLEWVLNTPSHHRVHHGTNVEYLDRNHAGIFIVWDRLFGTFEPERAPVDYGLTTNIGTFNPVRVAFHEWAAMIVDCCRANPLAVRLGYALRPPGWSPDGSTQTSAQRRRAFERSCGQFDGVDSGEVAFAGAATSSGK